ncbi:hypothetical protein, partial [Tetragenococcus muriaticus]|uniref:hypothetical protein n=1 Tax=Tetragenococcus muriaticus TaxID=64642 RepID=UPI000571E738
MKRLKITTIVLASTMLLMGCTQQTDSENNEDNEVAATSETVETTEEASTESASSDEQSETEEATEETSTEESSTESSTTESVEAENNVAELEEGPELQDTIDNVEDLNVETATDNPNKRVLLFTGEDEQQPQYKT